MRVLLDKKSRKILFEYLKRKYDAKTYLQLAQKLGVSFKTFKKWLYAEKNRHIPKNIVPQELKNKLIILDKQQDNWGALKGGGIGGKRSIEIMKRKLGEKEYLRRKSQIGQKVMNKLWRRYGSNLTKMTIRGKIRKRERESNNLEQANLKYFTNENIILKSDDIKFSRFDVKKEISFPKKMTEELAEEIGIHLGDGCLSYNRKYFSVKCNKKEKNYVDYLIRLYKKLYNLDLDLKIYPSVAGFEVCSNALFEFKHKVLGIPYGPKVGRIEIPKVILDSKNKEIYSSFIRGLFDTDGCVYLRDNRYPSISIFIKSRKLIHQLSLILKMMGFIPYEGQYMIVLNGQVMLKKWIKEIGSNNSKNINKLKWASSLVWIESGPAD